MAVSSTTEAEMVITELLMEGYEIYKFSVQGEVIASEEDCSAHTGDIDWLVQQACCCDEMGVFIRKNFGHCTMQGYLYFVFGNEAGVLVADYSYKEVKRLKEEFRSAAHTYNEETAQIIKRVHDQIMEVEAAVRLIQNFDYEVRI